MNEIKFNVIGISEDHKYLYLHGGGKLGTYNVTSKFNKEYIEKIIGHELPVIKEVKSNE